MNNCPDLKKDRVAYDYQFVVYNEVLAVNWIDNICEKLLTNHEKIESISQAKR